MGRDWPEVELEEAGVQLLDCEHKTPPPAPDGYPYVAIPQIKDGRLDLSGARRISRKHYVEWTRKTRPQEGDVIVVRRCSSGDTAVVPRGLECALGQNLVLLRADGTRVLPDYLRWLLRGPRWWDQVHTYINVGAVFDSLRCRDIPHFALTIPPLPQQAAIARILGSLDDKIELNRRMNETLEATARAIFKSWFVDFDPVRAKATGRAPVGLEPATAALFPDSFEDSPLGEIPAGWRVRPLDEIADFLNGLALQKYPPTGDESLPVIKIAQLRAGHADGADRAGLNVPPEYVIGDGDVLFSWSGSLVLRIWCGDRGALNQHLFKVTSQEHPKWFYCSWIEHHLPDFRAIAAGKATTMGHIQRHHLTEALTVVPDGEVLRAADRVISPLLDRVVTNAVESRTLAAIRDALLPKLLSGELRVRGAP